MSNPSVCFLSSVEIEGINFRVEDNLGESIHIHIGKLRISLSIEDYFAFSESVMKATRELFRIRGIELETLDAESLKGEWLPYYDKIKSVRIEETELESLYMKESYIKNRAIKRIIPLRESGYIKVLEGDRSDIEYYEEPGKLQPSRKQKLDFINQKILREGYPWNGNLILVNQDGYIYDGIKRASCLYALYSGNKKIPVLRICLPEKKSIDERRKIAENEIHAWNMSHADDKDIQKCEIQRKENIQLKELINLLNNINIPFFMLKREKRNAEGTLLAVVRIIVEEGKLNIIKKHLDIMQQKMSPYDDYQFLYTAQKPLYYLINDGPVLIFDRLCCENKFEKYILPMDRYIVQHSWKNIVWDGKWRCYCAAADIHILMILMDILLERGYFEQSDIEFIERHREVLYQQNFRIMIEKEFYHYASPLIEYLLSKQYNLAVTMYENFINY